MKQKYAIDFDDKLRAERPKQNLSQPTLSAHQQMSFIINKVNSLKLSNSFALHPFPNELLNDESTKAGCRNQIMSLSGGESSNKFDLMKENRTIRFFTKKNFEMKEEKLAFQINPSKKAQSKTCQTPTSHNRLRLATSPKSESNTTQTSGTESDLEGYDVTISQKTGICDSNGIFALDKFRKNVAKNCSEKVAGEKRDSCEKKNSNVDNNPLIEKQPRGVTTGNRTSIFKKLDVESESMLVNISKEDPPFLPFTMKEFPEEINPAEFFQQKLTCYQQFIEYAQKNININPTICLYHFNHAFDTFYIPFAIHLKGTNNPTSKTSYLPLSFSYFMVNCPDVVQLYFAHELMNMFLNDSKPIPMHFTFQDCKRLLSKLNGEISSTRNSFANRTNHRKSLFSNNRINVVIEDFEDLKDIDENRFDDSQKKAIATLLLNQSPLFSEKNLGAPKANHLREEEPIKEKVGINFDIVANNKQQSLSSSGSSSDSESKSSSSEGDSLEENEYSSKNPFVTQYSRLVHKFETFELRLTPAQIKLKTGKLETLTREQLEDLLFNFKSFNG